MSPPSRLPGRRKFAAKARKTAPVAAADQVTATEVKGISLRTIRGKRWIVVDVKAAGVDDQALEGLARLFRLQPEEVLAALLDQPINVKARRALYQYVYDTEPIAGALPRRPGAAEMRRILKRRARVKETSSNPNNLPPGVWVPREYPAFFDWQLSSVAGAKTFALPLSTGYSKVLDEAAEVRARQLKARSLQKPFKDLEDLLGPIRVHTDLLFWHITTLGSIGADRLKELAILDALEGMLSVIRRHPKTLSDEQLEALRAAGHTWMEENIRDDLRGDLQWCEELILELRVVKSSCLRHMVVEPKWGHAAKVSRERLEEATTLLGLLEAPAFVQLVDTATKNPDFVPYRLWEELCQALRNAGMALLQSPLADRFLTSHVEPMIQRLACRAPLTGMPASGRPEFDHELVRTIPPPASSSVFEKVAALAGVTNLTVGNLPGPASVAVILAKAAVPHLVKRVGASVVKGDPGLAGRLMRYMVNLGQLDANERAALYKAVVAGELRPIQSFEWDRHFQNSHNWGAGLAVINGIALIFAVHDDEAGTVARWTAIIGSAGGTGIAIATMFDRTRELFEKNLWGRKLTVGGMLGGVVGILGVVSATATMLDKLEDKDHFGAVLSGATMVGSAMSVIGFFVAAGAAVGSTGIGAPLGAVLEAIGLVIVLSAALADFLHGVFTNDSESLFKGFVEHFEKTTVFRATREVEPTLQSAWRDLKHKLNESGYRDIPYAKATADVVGVLIDFGFNDAQIARIIDESKLWVRMNHPKGKDLVMVSGD